MRGRAVAHSLDDAKIIKKKDKRLAFRLTFVGIGMFKSLPLRYLLVETTSREDTEAQHSPGAKQPRSDDLESCLRDHSYMKSAFCLCWRDLSQQQMNFI